MRNLKKVLALVLALAMVMTMFAGAISIDAKEFVDADSIATAAGKEASELLSALGVFVGNPDGTIKGQELVERQAMAKVLFYLKNANDDASFYATAAASFSDNTGWGRNYLAWASLNGIFAGDGKGIVRPTDGVTGIEAAKLLLATLGYDATTYGLVGANWKANTISLATSLGLLNGVPGSMEESLTREAVMIMVNNAVLANNGKLLKDTFGMTKITAVAVANKSFGLDAAWNADAASAYTSITADKLNATAKYLATGNANLSVFAYRDYIATSAANNVGYFTYKAIVANEAVKFADLGTEYDLLVKDLNTASHNSYDIRDIIVIGESDSQTITKGYVAAGVAKVPTAVASYVNNKPSSALALEDKDAKTTAPYIAKDNDQDGTYDFVWAAKYSYTTVADVTADGKITLAGDKNVASAPFAAGAYVLVNGEVAKGDQVFYYADGDITYIKKLDAFSGNITGYYGNDTYGINGTKYVISGLATARAKSFFANQEYALNNTQYTFVVDCAGSYNFVVDVLVNTNTKYADYAILVDMSDNDEYAFTMPYVKLFTADNQLKTYRLASVNGLPANLYNDLTYGLAWIQVVVELSDLIEDNGGALVSYVVDGDAVHVTTAAYGATTHTTIGASVGTVGSIYNPDTVFNFDTAINMWKMGNVGYLADTNGATVFAKSANTGWTAYAKDEFYGYASNGWGEVLYYWNAYGSVVVKAMALNLDKAPANILGTNGSIVIVNGAATYVYENGVYTYTVPVVGVNGAEASSITFKSLVPVSSFFVKGDVYKINVDAEGVLVNVVPVETSEKITNVENFITTTKATVEQFYVDAFGKMVLQINDGEAKYVNLADDADIYTVTKLGTESFATYDLYRLLNDFAGISATQQVEIYAIYDAAGVITTAIINIA